MRILMIIVLVCSFLIIPVSASELTAPAVPDSAAEYMPRDTDSFGEGLLELVKKTISSLRPDIRAASGLCLGVFAVVLVTSLTQPLTGNLLKLTELIGVVTIGCLLLQRTNALIHLGVETVEELSNYGKLLLPVMTAAMAAQGGITGSTALYTGTALFSGLLSSLITKVLTPLIYLFLAMSAGNRALGEMVLKKFQDFLKWLMTWSLKIILYVFTAYMGITGVVSGTTDAAALKAAKLTISGVVPVVGSILSDASEAVLVSAGVVKNAAGIYGIFAVLALCVNPFLRIGAHYLMLKVTGGLCSVFGSKSVCDFVGDFSSAMGLLLAMTGSVCLLLLISTVCFLRGVGG